MQDAFHHAIGFVFATALAMLGRFVTRHPEKMVRFFTFGAGPETGFYVAFSRITGWFWLIGGIFGAFMYPLLIANDLLYPH